MSFSGRIIVFDAQESAAIAWLRRRSGVPEDAQDRGVDTTVKRSNIGHPSSTVGLLQRVDESIDGGDVRIETPRPLVGPERIVTHQSRHAVKPIGAARRWEGQCATVTADAAELHDSLNRGTDLHESIFGETLCKSVRSGISGNLPLISRGRQCVSGEGAAQLALLATTSLSEKESILMAKNTKNTMQAKRSRLSITHSRSNSNVRRRILGVEALLGYEASIEATWGPSSAQQDARERVLESTAELGFPPSEALYAAMVQVQLEEFGWAPARDFVIQSRDWINHALAGGVEPVDVARYVQERY